ncbi:hypothetical protein OY671_011280, partial [Metschnikowia pulcherrima]
IVQMMRDAGASEVHMRVASPPTEHSCFYGVDTPERSKSLAARMNVPAMADFIQADRSAFVSIDGLYRAVGEAQRNNGCPQYCDACFTGDYPTRSTDGSGPSTGQVASVTGASRGIGAETARASAAAGAHVVLVARSAKELEQ